MSSDESEEIKIEDIEDVADVFSHLNLTNQRFN